MCEARVFGTTGFLAAFCVFFSMSTTAQVAHFEAETTASNMAMTVDLSNISSTSGSALVIRNNSESKLNFPFMWNSNSRPPVTSIRAFSSLASNTSSDEAFALEVWRYVSTRVNPYCSAGSRYEYVGDPLRLLYGSGFGCCGQLAMTLASLWSGALRIAGTSQNLWQDSDLLSGRTLGLAARAPLRSYPTRIAVMAFHTIPEIYYGNAWHMLDPDHRVFYRNPDGTIASVAQILANPSLVAQTPDGAGWNSAMMAELYESNRTTLQYTPLTYSVPANPLFTLLPHESMQLADENSWPTAVYSPISPGEAPPPFSGIGQICFRRSINFNNRSTASLDAWRNVQTALQPDGRTAVVNAGQDIGSVMVTKRSPFPIFGLEVSGEFFSNDPAGSINVEASADGLTWSSPIIVPIAAGAPAATQSIDLTSFLAGATTYFVKILLHGSPGSLGIYNMEVRMDGQFAGQMFPLLQFGQVNTLKYQDLSPGTQERSVEIELTIPTGRLELENLTATSLLTEDPTYSIAADYRASHLVDGNPATLAYPGQTQVDYDVNLKTPCHITQVSIWWGYFGTNPVYVKEWRLYGRSSATDSWSLIRQGGFPNSSEMDIPVDAISTDLRLTANSDNWIGVFELKVYGDEVAPIRGSSELIPASVVSNVPVSSLLGYPTAGLIDGDPSTLAYPAAPDLDYEVDFGRDTPTDFANIHWGYFGTSPLYVQRWTIFGQRDGEFGWSLLAHGGFPGTEETHSSINRTVRRLRLRADGPNWIGVYEFSVFGASYGSKDSATALRTP